MIIVFNSFEWWFHMHIKGTFSTTHSFKNSPRKKRLGEGHVVTPENERMSTLKKGPFQKEAGSSSKSIFEG